MSLDDAPEPSVPETAGAICSLLARRLRQYVASLPEKPRLVMILRYQEDMLPEDIAKVLATPVATVKSHLQRSLAMLREKVTRTMGEVSHMNPIDQNPNRLENALKDALRREEVPENFAAKVLTRVAQKSAEGEPQHSWLSVFSRPSLRWAAVAAVSICITLGALHYRHLQRERAQGEAAKQQLMLALRIAGTKLQLAKSKVNEINAARPESQPDNRTPRSRS